MKAEKEENISVEIINVFGQALLNKTELVKQGTNRLKFNIGNFVPGIYTVKIKKDTGESRIKILKNN